MYCRSRATGARRAPRPSFVPRLPTDVVSRAFVDDDRDDSGPKRDFHLPPADAPEYDAACARAILEAAREGITAAAEQATGYYWGEERLRPFVESILAEAVAAGDERLEQLARRYLR